MGRSGGGREGITDAKFLVIQRMFCEEATLITNFSMVRKGVGVGSQMSSFMNNLSNLL